MFTGKQGELPHVQWLSSDLPTVLLPQKCRTRCSQQFSMMLCVYAVCVEIFCCMVFVHMLLLLSSFGGTLLFIPAAVVFYYVLCNFCIPLKFVNEEFCVAEHCDFLWSNSFSTATLHSVITVLQFLHKQNGLCACIVVI